MITCKSCNVPCSDDAIYCSRCGAKIEKQLEPPKIPRAMTIKEAAKIFFSGTVSQGFIYTAIREHRLPHVKMSSGKILLDADELNQWWQDELAKSKAPTTSGLRKIM